ncbi:MAG: CBS domain-containing protein [Candidatus Aenigmatarchaeota archaeon]|nr:MAG: CBS domain-containing protein [Candidatus Aenigmarchaeota archaeon]
MVLKVRDEMNRNVKTLSPAVTVKEASEKMTKYWMGSVVITENNNIVGIITERDILSKVVVKGKNPGKVKISDIMSKNVITIEEDKELGEAVKLMKVNDIKKLPVTKKGKLSGIITTTDIITAMNEGMNKEDVKLGSYRDLKVLVRRHAIELKTEIEKNQMLTFVIPNSLYPSDSVSIMKAVSETVPKFIFVTVNKPYFSLLQTLKKHDIPTEGMYFIDASSEEGEPQSGKNFEKIRTPADITEIMIAVDKALKTKKYFGLVFDSVSTLLTYHSEEIVSKFLHSLINKLRKHEVKGIFLCTKEDIKTSMMKNLNMLADYSVDIEKRGELSS